MGEKTEKADPELVEAVIKLLNQGFDQGYVAGIQVGKEQGHEEGFETCLLALRRAIDSLNNTDEISRYSILSITPQDLYMMGVITGVLRTHLENSGIHNLGELIEKTEDDLLDIENFMPENLDEVIKLLKQYRLHLKVL